MFYKEDEISELIVCKKCTFVYEDPRILNCGESMCNQCISLLLNKETNSLKCPICNEIHSLPITGFKKNLALAKLINIKPNEVSRSPLADEFKRQLNLVRDKTRAIEQEWKTGKEKIKNYCDVIRNDVDSVTESCHQYINKYHDEFIEQVNTYEHDCMQRYEQINKNNKLKDFIQANDLFYNKWSQYFKMFKVNDVDLLISSNEARKLALDLEKRDKTLKYDMFNGKLLKFEPDKNLPKSIKFGEVTYEPILGRVNQIKGRSL